MTEREANLYDEFEVKYFDFLNLKSSYADRHLVG
jgi:hypothetical protein